MTDGRTGAQRRRDLETAGIVLALGLILALWSLRGVIYHGLDATFGHRPLNAVRSWHYHLMNLDIEILAKTPADAIVTEYSASTGTTRAWTPDDVQRMKRKPDGGKRIVLSYFSIGEAESYRFYWRPEWSQGDHPAWYVAENCAWPRNYMVRFWHDSWKDIIFRNSDSFLRRIINAGFDGVYLDRVDVFWEQIKERPAARDDMIQFVSEIAAEARRIKPGFLVVAQNAEDLLDEPRYRDVIDGLGKEDLLYGHKGTNTRNPEKEIRESLGHIRRLQWDWKPVVAVEYVTEPALIQATQVELRGYGMIPTNAHRSLDGLAPLADRPPSTIKYGTPEWIAEMCKDKRHW